MDVEFNICVACPAALEDCIEVAEAICCGLSIVTPAGIPVNWVGADTLDGTGNGTWVICCC